MQDSKTSPARKPWYQRAMAMAKLATKWSKTIPKSPPEILRPSRSNKTYQNQNQNHQLRKCKSLKLAANSFTRVCLCASISPYDEVFRNYVPPRRSSSYPPSKPLLPVVNETVVAARMSVDSGRRVFRGKSLEENELMKRFVVAEEEAMMENRRRDFMEIVKKRNQMRKKKKLGPSPLSRMVIAEDDDEQDLYY